jgi:hypothetical protein
MRVGDFSVEIIAADGRAREIESGHVLARPGQVYTLRLRNHGPLRAVADIAIDGRSVTGGGLVINAWSVVDLERPIHETERGRFTVIAEGNERVFGPDGGRDNPDLGLIEARFRRELPDQSRDRLFEPIPSAPPRPIYPTQPSPEPSSPWRPGSPRWTLSALYGGHEEAKNSLGGGIGRSILSRMAAPQPPAAEPAAPVPRETPGAFDDLGAIERAAGTGLTGSSQQEFTSVHIGALEPTPTVIRLRLVIGSEEALAAPRPLPEADTSPARPAARP